MTSLQVVYVTIVESWQGMLILLLRRKGGKSGEVESGYGVSSRFFVMVVVHSR